MPIQTVAIVIHDKVQALDIAGPIDVFTEANLLIPAGDRYKTILIGPEQGVPLRASSGMQISADVSFENAPTGLDVLLVAGGPRLPYEAPAPQCLNWLRDAPSRAKIYGSICTGAFALGHAGLLDGRRATTHWLVAEKLAAQFPAALVEPDLIYVRDDRLVTSAGVTAGIDLALALVSERHGPGVAVAAAKRLLVVAQRQGGQSQFSPYLTVPSDPDSPIARIQDYVMANIGRPHSLESLALEVGMSARNLVRHFVQETRITPHEFVVRARIDAARMLLEGTDHGLKAVAFQCGFGSVDRMRAVFHQRLGVTPSQYRTSFRQEKSRNEPTDVE